MPRREGRAPLTQGPRLGALAGCEGIMAWDGPWAMRRPAPESAQEQGTRDAEAGKRPETPFVIADGFRWTALRGG